ncbi:GntR family transcriptional regulator [Pseudonocardia lutea]|uniref:GntR family transcriptional regulator n=1 Tax=Pseudonocardia lutea TaxID=2172015 RepID=A0ABW1IIA2_9PSEU
MNDSVLRIERPHEMVRNQLFRVIRQAILDGILSPGEKLTERRLIELTGTSRTSIREALRQLQAAGLVETSVSRGVQVVTLTTKDVLEIYEVRQALESQAIANFTERADQALVEEACALIQPFENREQTRETVERFEALILRGSGNELLSQILGNLHDRIQVLRNLSMSDPSRWEESHAEYVALVDAIRSRDPERARRATVDHVTAARNAALRALARNENGD